MRAIGYIRVSTNIQEFGPEVQRLAIEKRAQELGCTEILWFDDIGISGSKGLDGRPGLLAAINSLERNDYFLVAKLDRLARDLMTQLVLDSMIKKAKATLISCHGEGTSLENDPQARFMMQILGAVAELERALIQQRTKAAMAMKRAKGEKTGGKMPYGYTSHDGKLIPKQDEQLIIQKILRYRTEGVTIRGIIAELNRASIPTKFGCQWNISQIQKVIKLHGVS